MLSSLLKIEQLLECELCSSTLRQTRTIGECGHRFCLECVTDSLKKASECPTCKLPAAVKNLRKDTMHDNLVTYVNKLKLLLLSHSLTPLEESLSRKDLELDVPSHKRTNSTQESEENYEDEYNDMIPDRKKFKRSTSSLDILHLDDPSAFMDDLLDTPVRPTRQVKTPPKYTVDWGSSDEEMEEPVVAAAAPSRPPVVNDEVERPRTPDETETSSTTWFCPDCQFKNKSYMQTCQICHKFKNRNIPATANSPKKKKSKAKDTTSHAESSISKKENGTMAGRSLESATVPITRRTLVEKKEDVHIMYTSVTPSDEESIAKMMAKVAESKLKISIHEQLKDFNEVTHVITSVDKKKQSHRTLKYLRGVLEGKWVVEPKWLVDSMKAKQWLPEDKYEVKGDAVSGLTHAPTKGRERKQNKEDRLFENMRFYFAGEFPEKHNKKDLGVLLRAGGADVMNRKPSGFGHPVDAEGAIDRSEPVIIFSKAATKKKQTWLYEYQVRDPSWIIEYISKLEVN